MTAGHERNSPAREPAAAVTGQGAAGDTLADEVIDERRWLVAVHDSRCSAAYPLSAEGMSRTGFFLLSDGSNFSRLWICAQQVPVERRDTSIFEIVDTLRITFNEAQLRKPPVTALRPLSREKQDLTSNRIPP
jgi:hypothetical protein